MTTKELSKATSDLLHDTGALTTHAVDNRALLLLARTQVLLSLLVDEVKKLEKLTHKH